MRKVGFSWLNAAPDGRPHLMAQIRNGYTGADHSIAMLIDTGATYTCLPDDVLLDVMGVVPSGSSNVSGFTGRDERLWYPNATIRFWVWDRDKKIAFDFTDEIGGSDAFNRRNLSEETPPTKSIEGVMAAARGILGMDALRAAKVRWIEFNFPTELARLRRT